MHEISLYSINPSNIVHSLSGKCGVVDRTAPLTQAQSVHCAALRSLAVGENSGNVSATLAPIRLLICIHGFRDWNPRSILNNQLGNKGFQRNRGVSTSERACSLWSAVRMRRREMECVEE